MSDREFENYLVLLTGMLRLRRTQRESISGELRDHLIEHVAQLEGSGIAHEEAVRRALEEFGDAAALAANFQVLVGMRRRRLIMRCTIGTTIVMTGLVVAMLAFRPDVVDDPGIAQAQDGPKDAARESQPLTATEKIDVGQNAKSYNEIANEATRRKLVELVDVDFTETPLSLAIDVLAKKVGTQHLLDSKALVDLAITSDDPVTLQLKQVPAEFSLEMILRPLQLTYTLRNGVIIVSSMAEVDSNPDTRVYYVPAHSTQELVRLIPSLIAPTTWDKAGGLGAIHPFRDSLVISQTWHVHREIDKLLADLAPVLAKGPGKALEDDAAVQTYGSTGESGFGEGGSRGGYGSTGGGGGYGATGYGGRGQPGYGSTGGGYGRSAPGRNRGDAGAGYGGGGYGAAPGGYGGTGGAASAGGGYGAGAPSATKKGGKETSKPYAEESGTKAENGSH